MDKVTISQPLSLYFIQISKLSEISGLISLNYFTQFLRYSRFVFLIYSFLVSEPQTDKLTISQPLSIFSKYKTTLFPSTFKIKGN